MGVAPISSCKRNIFRQNAEARETGMDKTKGVSNVALRQQWNKEEYAKKAFDRQDKQTRYDFLSVYLILANTIAKDW